MSIFEPVQIASSAFQGFNWWLYVGCIVGGFIIAFTVGTSLSENVGVGACSALGVAIAIAFIETALLYYHSSKTETVADQVKTTELARLTKNQVTYYNNNKDDNLQHTYKIKLSDSTSQKPDAIVNLNANGIRLTSASGTGRAYVKVVEYGVKHHALNFKITPSVTNTQADYTLPNGKSVHVVCYVNDQVNAKTTKPDTIVLKY